MMMKNILVITFYLVSTKVFCLTTEQEAAQSAHQALISAQNRLRDCKKTPPSDDQNCEKAQNSFQEAQDKQASAYQVQCMAADSKKSAQDCEGKITATDSESNRGSSDIQCGDKNINVTQLEDAKSDDSMSECLRQYDSYLEKNSYTNLTQANIMFLITSKYLSQDDLKKANAVPPLCQTITELKKYQAGLKKFKECAVRNFILNKYDRKWSDPSHVQKNQIKGPNGMVCSNVGILTLDFEACNNFVNHMQTADVVQNVATEAQKMKYGMDMQDEQIKAAASKNTATAGLQGQKKSFEAQQSMADQQAAMEGVKLALLASDYSDMPSSDEIQNRCSEINAVGSSSLGQALKGISIDACKTIVASNIGLFLPNQAMKDKMKAKLVEIGGKAAVDLVLADMLGKRANQVGNAIAAVDGVTPLAPIAPTDPNALVNFCQLNPASPQCLGADLGRSFDGISGNSVVDFGGGSLGTIYSPGSMDPNATTGSGANAIGSSSATKGAMGTNTVAANHAGGLLDRAAGAQMDGKGGGAPGGGSGGGGSGGGGGGTGSAPGGAAAAGGPTAASAGGKTTYEGSGKGSLSMMGGFGIVKNKDKKADTGNPFGKLFDKSKTDPNLNFRAPASSVGNKGDNLFQMITKRYNVVSSDKRLIEYEQAAPTP